MLLANVTDWFHKTLLRSRHLIFVSLSQRVLLDRSCKSEEINYSENPKGAGTTGPPTGKVSYGVMVVEAVVFLNDRHGSTLSSIRKYITANYELKKQQAASFNNLTMKALNKAVALDELERINVSTFRLSKSELDRRKEREKKSYKAMFNAIEVRTPVCRICGVLVDLTGFRSLAQEIRLR